MTHRGEDPLDGAEGPGGPLPLPHQGLLLGGATGGGHFIFSPLSMSLISSFRFLVIFFTLLIPYWIEAFRAAVSLAVNYHQCPAMVTSVV